MQIVLNTDPHVKANADEIHCTLEARLVGLAPVVVKDHAGTAHQAIHGAVGKLQRAIDTALAKHEPRRSTASATETESSDSANYQQEP